ncbi:hypothetical protein U1701_13105 [Sphingomonas sp. PB2P19]|uniref:hypothetical protein n=1 Tax=Sphingomonas rhamnosi TaxID=3096156 RepID=UPI002FCC143B
MQFVGVDWSASSFRAQVRLRGDTPGPPQIALGNVTVANTEGLRVVGVAYDAGLPTTTVAGYLSKETMSSAAKLPYGGEAGDDSLFEWGVQIDGITRIVGPFWAVASPIDSDLAPLARPSSGGTNTTAPGSFSNVALTIAQEDVVRVSIDGAELLTPYLVAAESLSQIATDARIAAEAIAKYRVSAAAGQADPTIPVNEGFSVSDGVGGFIYYRKTAGQPVEIGRSVSLAAIADTIANNRRAVFTTADQPGLLESEIGDQWLSPSGTIYARNAGNGITISGHVLMIGGRVPVLPWSRAQSQPLETINARLDAIENGAS